MVDIVGKRKYLATCTVYGPPTKRGWYGGCFFGFRNYYIFVVNRPSWRYLMVACRIGIISLCGYMNTVFDGSTTVMVLARLR